MDYAIKSDGNIQIVSLSGSIFADEQTKEITEAVNSAIEDGAKLFVVDLAEMKFINSSGLNFLLTVLTKARKAGGEAVLTNISDQLNKLLVITKLNNVFIVTEDLDSAKAKLESTTNA